MSEYIKKEDVLSLAKEIYHQHGNMMIIEPEDVDSLPTYSVPEREKGTDFPQAEDIKPTVESFKRTMDNVDKLMSEEKSDVPEREKGTDLISREAVIDLLNQFGYYDKEMERDLSAIPSAVPEREKGDWIMDDGINAVCPKCNKLNGARGDFCKWCGADMRGK